MFSCYLAFLTAFFLLAEGNELWALSPKTGLDPQPRFVSFEQALSESLESGFFNEVFETDEPLDFIEAVPAGDPHVYFSIEHVEVKKEFARVNVSALIQNERGEISTMPMELEVSGRFQYDDEETDPFVNKDMLMKKLYLEIDEVIRRGFFRNGEWKEFLFRNGTKEVRFKGRESGKEYRIIYKFGRVVQAEYFGAKMLKQFGLPVPRMFYRPGETHLWVEYRENDFPGREAAEQVWVYPDKKMEDLFYQVGRATVFLYLLGHEDFHPGNLLVSNGEGLILDFETTGQGVVFDKYFGKTMTHFQLVSELFVNMPKEFSPRDISRFQSGMRDAAVIGRRFYRAFLREWERSLLSELRSRLVIRWTMSYRSGDMDVIPHYTVFVGREHLAAMIQKRAEDLLDELQTIYLTYDPDSERGVTFRSSYWGINLAFEAAL